MPKPCWSSPKCESFLGGRIKVYLADARDFLPRLALGSVDFVITDPPFGHSNNDGDMASRWEAIFEGRKEAYDRDKEFRPISNDGPEANDLFKWSIGQYERILKRGACCCCCCGGGGPDPQFARWSLWLDEAFHGGFKHMVCWDKGPIGLGHHYRRSYETLLVAQKKGAACKWYDETNAVENILRPGDYGIRKIIPREDQHPTIKPVALAEHFIGLHTQENDLVLDPFMGAGWAGIACIRMNRRFIGVEIDPKWYKEAVAFIRGEVEALEKKRPKPLVLGKD